MNKTIEYQLTEFREQQHYLIPDISKTMFNSTPLIDFAIKIGWFYLK